jgi:hypothetical protein
MENMFCQENISQKVKLVVKKGAAAHATAPTVKFNLSGPFGPPPARLSVLAAILRFPAVNA